MPANMCKVLHTQQLTVTSDFLCLLQRPCCYCVQEWQWLTLPRHHHGQRLRWPSTLAQQTGILTHFPRRRTVGCSTSGTSTTSRQQAKIGGDVPPYHLSTCLLPIRHLTTLHFQLLLGALIRCDLCCSVPTESILHAWVHEALDALDANEPVSKPPPEWRDARRKEPPSLFRGRYPYCHAPYYKAVVDIGAAPAFKPCATFS